MAEFGPGNRWVLVTEIKADPGGSMAIVDGDIYRPPCMSSHPGVPTYTKAELAMIKHIPHSAGMFRSIQRIKKAFPMAKVIKTILAAESDWKREQ